MLDIEDNAYKEVGCLIASRAEVFAKSDAIFSLKLLQPVDYPSIKVGQLIIGWTHPHGSGKNFMNDQAFPKDLVVVDLDNNFPGIFYKNEVISANIPKGLFYRNSFYAGLAGVIHAFTSYGFLVLGMFLRERLIVPQNFHLIFGCFIVTPCQSLKRISGIMISLLMALKLELRTTRSYHSWNRVS